MLASIDPEHPERAGVMESIAAARIHVGDPERAEEILREALEVATRTGRPGDLASVQASLASVLQMTGQEVAEALDLIEAALPVTVAERGEESPAAVEQRMVRLRVLLDLQEFSAVRAEGAVVLANMQKRLGKESVVVAAILDLLAKAWSQGEGRDFERAESMLREALRVELALYPEGHPAIAHRMSGIGAFLMTADRLDEARDCFIEAGDRLRRVFGDGDRLIVAIADMNVGVVETRLGRFASAQEYLGRARESLVRQFGSTDMRALDAAIWLARARTGGGDPAGAEEVLRSALAPFLAGETAGIPALVATRELVTLLLRDERRAEARELVERILEPHAGDAPVGGLARLIDALRELVRDP